MQEVLEFSAGEVREVMKSFYQTCRIPWCQEHTHPTREEQRQIKTDTLEHIIPKALGGSDHLNNLTYTVAYCNGRKGHDISNKRLMGALIKEANENWLLILEILLSRRFPLSGKNKGFYVVRILSVVYEVKITRKGTIRVIKERSLTTEEITLFKIRDLQLYSSP